MSRSYDTYRPGSFPVPARTVYDRLPPPPPPTDMPPLPPGPPPARLFGAPQAGDSYRPSGQYPHYAQQNRFNGDSWRPPGATENYPARNDFSFRVNGNAPNYPDEKERDEAAAKYKARIANNARRGERGASRGGYRQRSFAHRPPTAERPLLTTDGAEESEQMLGIHETAAQRYLAAEDLSDSGEDMDESNSESEAKDESALTKSMIPNSTDADETNLEEQPERPSKRRALTALSDETSSAPKWSNPDPYTVLPPVDESQRKRKDVVKLIRKARVAAEKGDALQNEVSANNDFISFGFEDDRIGEPDNARSPVVPGAPTGPRQQNRVGHLNYAIKVAPGTPTTNSIAAMGPPPGLPAKPTSGLPPKLGVVPREGVSPGNLELKLPPKPDTSIPSLKPSTASAEHPSEAQNGALGSRKRTHNDEIKAELPRPPHKKGKGEQTNGSLTDDWIPAQGKDPTPWLMRSTLKTENPGFRLHKEICDFYDFVKPQKFEQTVREDLIERIQKVVKGELPNCNVHCFGSFAAGLYLPNADMDLVVISNSYRDSGEKAACHTNTAMRRFGSYLGRTIAEPDSIEVITGAKVPIIKFVDRATAIRVDVSFENDTGIIANDTFALWKRLFPAMPVLVTIIKQFLMIRGLNDVATGGLGGFSVTCLVTSMLQNMPRVQTGELIPEHHLGEMLIEFLDFYGNQLDIARTGISMNPPGYFDKASGKVMLDRNSSARRNISIYKADRTARLAIIDPNRSSNDISGGSRNVPLIFDRFSRAHQEIMAALTNPKRTSLLDWLLGGDYDNFAWHRNHLRKLYEQRWGPLDWSRTVNPQVSSANDFSFADHAIANLDIRSSPATNKVLKLVKGKKKVGKSVKHQGNAAALKKSYPTISERLPSKIKASQRLAVLESLYQHMSKGEQKKYASEKAKQKPKVSQKRKLKRIVSKNADA